MKTTSYQFCTRLYNSSSSLGLSSIALHRNIQASQDILTYFPIRSATSNISLACLKSKLKYCKFPSQLENQAMYPGQPAIRMLHSLQKTSCYQRVEKAGVLMTKTSQTKVRHHVLKRTKVKCRDAPNINIIWLSCTITLRGEGHLNIHAPQTDL